jgi:hypothetical protein
MKKVVPAGVFIAFFRAPFTKAGPQAGQAEHVFMIGSGTPLGGLLSRE